MTAPLLPFWATSPLLQVVWAEPSRVTSTQSGAPVHAVADAPTGVKSESFASPVVNAEFFSSKRCSFHRAGETSRPLSDTARLETCAARLLGG